MLERFERLVEQAVQGGVRRVFATSLQPVELARAAARAMEESRVVGPYGVDVPNRYTLRLAQEDLSRFDAYRGSLSDDIAAYLADYALERRLRPTGTPRVIFQLDSRVRLGSVRVDATFDELEPERQRALEAALEGTRHIRAISTTRPASGAAWLEDENGGRTVLDPSIGIVRIGRSLDNELVLPDHRVSRFHSQIRWDGQAWLVSDLGSTNGTFVGERRVESEPLPLRPGVTLRVATQVLSYHEGPSPER